MGRARIPPAGAIGKPAAWLTLRVRSYAAVFRLVFSVLCGLWDASAAPHGAAVLWPGLFRPGATRSLDSHLVFASAPHQASSPLWQADFPTASRPAVWLSGNYFVWISTFRSLPAAPKDEARRVRRTGAGGA